MSSSSRRREFSQARKNSFWGVIIIVFASIDRRPSLLDTPSIHSHHQRAQHSYPLQCLAPLFPLTQHDFLTTNCCCSYFVVLSTVPWSPRIITTGIQSVLSTPYGRLRFYNWRTSFYTHSILLPARKHVSLRRSCIDYTWRTKNVFRHESSPRQTRLVSEDEPHWTRSSITLTCTWQSSYLRVEHLLWVSMRLFYQHFETTADANAHE